MKTKHTLMLLAASLATPALHAQTADTATLTPILRELAAVPQSPALTADQRAAKLGDMALLPADTEMYLSLPHIDQTVANLQTSPLMAPLMMLMQQKGIQLNSLPVTSFTVATGPGSSALLAKSYITLLQALPHLCNSMGKTHMTETVSLETLDASVQSLAASPLPPVTVIAGIDPQMAAMAPMFFEQMKQKAAASSDPTAQWHEATYAGLNWQGAKLIGKELAAHLREEAQDDAHAAMLNGIADKLATRDFYLLATVKDNKVILTFTENPEKDIKIAATPAESILATNKVAFADARMDKNPDMLCYIDAAFTKNILDALTNGTLAAITPQQQAFMMQSAKMATPAASSMIVWADKGVHFEAINGNSTAIDLDSPLRLIGLADKPETILYTEGALSTPGQQMLAAQFNSAFDLLVKASNKKAPTDPNTITIDLTPPQQVLEMFKGYLQAFSALNGRYALLMDNKGTMPDAAKLHPAYGPYLDGFALPRLALYAGVSDRAAIGNAWTTIETAGKQLLAQSNRPNVRWPEQTVQQAGGITNYSFNNEAGNVAENGINPLAAGLSNVFVSISDKSWAIGGSPDYTSSVVATADNPISSGLNGSVFALRFAPIQEMLNKDLPILQQMGINTLKAQGIMSFIFSQVDGLYATMNRQGDTIRTHYYFKTK